MERQPGEVEQVERSAGSPGGPGEGPRRPATRFRDFTACLGLPLSRIEGLALAAHDAQPGSAGPAERIGVPVLVDNDAPSVARAAVHGDLVAYRVLDQAARWLSGSVTSTADLLDQGRLVLTGPGVVVAGSLHAAGCASTCTGPRIPGGGTASRSSSAPGRGTRPPSGRRR